MLSSGEVEKKSDGKVRTRASTFGGGLVEFTHSRMRSDYHRSTSVLSCMAAAEGQGVPVT